MFVDTNDGNDTFDLLSFRMFVHISDFPCDTRMQIAKARRRSRLASDGAPSAGLRRQRSACAGAPEAITLRNRGDHSAQPVADHTSAFQGSSGTHRAWPHSVSTGVSPD